MSRRIDRLRPVLLLRGLRAGREHPNLVQLAAETDPERFVWRILPHAARSFATSIVVLPKSQALAAAVGYLYCRMLDTYEDLLPDKAARPDVLRLFAERFGSDPMPAAPAVDETLARDDRDRLGLLLVERCRLVDDVLATLPLVTRESIARLVSSMAEGMAQSADIFERQGGVLVDSDQVARYSHHVIGNPALFILTLMGGATPSPAQEKDALAVSEMIQMANITRDIEKDLSRGVGYHHTLKPFLNASGDATKRREVVRRVREEYLGHALAAVPAYRRLFEGSPRRLAPGARMAAALMMLHTDQHYRRCAIMTGHEPWGQQRGKVRTVTAALPALLSMTGARRTLRRIEEDFLEAAARQRALVVEAV
ncbi:MAG: squalene/phytoene synthase family protein [Acidimicrobiia bacterium]|nr:squalene/phytoene synthase family protein [Acidimicrobiia bacterium]